MKINSVHTVINSNILVVSLPPSLKDDLGNQQQINQTSDASATMQCVLCNKDILAKL